MGVSVQVYNRRWRVLALWEKNFKVCAKNFKVCARFLAHAPALKPPGAGGLLRHSSKHLT